MAIRNRSLATQQPQATTIRRRRSRIRTSTTPIAQTGNLMRVSLTGTMNNTIWQQFSQILPLISDAQFTIGQPGARISAVPNKNNVSSLAKARQVLAAKRAMQRTA
jgi:hypothetical protein